MRKMKINTERPWLTSTGVEISTPELLEISKSWSAQTWEAYLNWYQSSCQEVLIIPAIYDKIGEEQIENIFELFGSESCSERQEWCEHLLSNLPEDESAILKAIFFEGQTIRKIAATRRAAKTTVHNLKNRGISRLKRGNFGDGWDTRQYMKGESFLTNSHEQKICEPSFLSPAEEGHSFDPENYKAELMSISSLSFRKAISDLPEGAQRILYLCHWCKLSTKQIARQLRRGMNVIEQIEAASISKLKRGFLFFELGSNYGGGK